jgi:hypothetical protein
MLVRSRGLAVYMCALCYLYGSRDPEVAHVAARHVLSVMGVILPLQAMLILAARR